MSATEKYFQAHNNYFWQWEDKMEVIGIPAGSTIAYRQHALEMLEDITSQGIPPFGSLLLCMMATNPNAAESIDQAHSILGKTLGTTDDADLANAISFLKVLSDLPKEYKQGGKRKILFRSIFNECHNIRSAQESAEILKKGITFANHLLNAAASALAKYDLKPLAVLYKRYPDTDAIINNIASVPLIKEEIQLEADPLKEKKEADFIDELIDNETTFHAGALVRRIWSGLHIPFHNHLPSQQPLGGVSDITNKGDLSRLLISEFANDDLTLMSRLANHEALYINREVPPEKNDLKRIILMDVSIRNWGTPKTLAFASTLAIAKHPKSNFECEAYVLGKNFHAVGIDSVHSIIDGLQIVEGSPDCSEGLEKFFEANDKNRNMEIFFISTRDAVKSAVMQKVISEYYSRFTYWMHTDDEGGISLFRKQNNSKKHIQDLKLPLEELWKREKRVKTKPVSLPADTTYPILFRNPLNTRKVLVCPDGEVYKITGEKNLIRLYDKDSKYYDKGWEMVMENLPAMPASAEIGRDENGDNILLAYVANWKMIYLINLRTKQRIDVPFEEWRSHPYSDFIFHQGQFYYPAYNRYWRISLDGKTQKIDVRDEMLLEAYKTRNKIVSDAWSKFSYGTGVFKNITNVCINDKKELVFNSHRLSIKQDGKTIKMEPDAMLPSMATGTRESHTEFLFPDGSMVTNNRAGMLTLRSSNPTIPAIYIPSVIDNALGLAAGDSFTGSTYYYKESLFIVKLTDPGPSKLTVIKHVKTVSSKGLKEVKDLVESDSPIILNSASYNTATRLVSELRKEGAKAEISPVPGNTGLRQIPPQEFFNAFIHPFVNHILKHGN
jgi:ribosomal protein L7/L12